MPKKKSNQLKVREKNFNEAAQIFDATIQSVQSTSLLPYEANYSELAYLRDAGFQVYDNPLHIDFQNVFLAWMPTSITDSSRQPHCSFMSYQNSVANSSLVPIAAMTPSTPTDRGVTELPSLLSTKTAIPCIMNWEFEAKNSFPTLILKAPLLPKLPFGEKQYSFPCFDGEEARLLAAPVTTADPFVIQHYKCAMEWRQLLSTCIFPQKFLHEDISHLVTYQIIYDSLLQMIDILNLYLFMKQKHTINDVTQEIIILIKDYSDQFTHLDKPPDLFRKNLSEIKKQLAKLELLSKSFNWLLMAQGLFHSEKQGIDSFHRVSPDLILYIQNGPFASDTCCFTGLLSWLHALTLLPNISALVQYTVETTEQTGLFLEECYATRLLEFTPSKKNFLLKESVYSIRAKLDKRANTRVDLYKLPKLKKEVLLTIDKEAVDDLVINTTVDLAEQLFDYLIKSSKPFASPFSFYSVTSPLPAMSLGLIFNRLASLVNYCVDNVIIPAIRGVIPDKQESQTVTHLQKLKIIIIDNQPFMIYPTYLKGDNFCLIKEALYAQLKILILNHLIQDANDHTIHAKVSGSFFLLLKKYFQDYFTLLKTLEVCTQQKRFEFITKHNIQVENKSVQAEKELLAEENKIKDRLLKRNKPPIKILKQQISIETSQSSEVSVPESLKEVHYAEDKLQKQLDQLQNEMNRVTKGIQLSSLVSTDAKIDYLFNCIDSFEKILEGKGREIGNEKMVDILNAIVRVEIFYYLGLSLPYLATQFFNNKNINNFRPLLITLKNLKQTLEDISALYASILAEHDSTSHAQLYLKKLDMLLINVSCTVNHTEKNIKQVDDSLQRDLNEKLQKKPSVSRPTIEYLQPLYIAVPDYRSLRGFFNLNIAIQEFKTVSNEFSDCSQIVSSLKESIKIKNSERVVISQSSAQFFNTRLTTNTTTSQSSDSSVEDVKNCIPSAH